MPKGKRFYSKDQAVSLGDFIRKERLRAFPGLSAAAFAQKIDVPKDLLSRIENGERPPTMPQVFAIAEAFKTTVEDLNRRAGIHTSRGNLPQPVQRLKSGRRPVWVNELLTAVKDSGQAAADAIKHQEDEFMKAVAEQRRDYNKALTDLVGAIQRLNERIDRLSTPGGVAGRKGGAKQVPLPGEALGEFVSDEPASSGNRKRKKKRA